MIRFENNFYRIESHNNLPKRFSLDFKKLDGIHTHLVNIGWYDTYEQALDAMNKHSGGVNVEQRPGNI